MSAVQQQTEQEAEVTIVQYYAMRDECMNLRAINADLGGEIKRVNSVCDELRNRTLFLVKMIDRLASLNGKAQQHFMSIYTGGKGLAKEFDEISRTDMSEVLRTAQIAKSGSLTPPPAPPKLVPNGRALTPDEMAKRLAPKIQALAAAE